MLKVRVPAAADPVKDRIRHDHIHIVESTQTIPVCTDALLEQSVADIQFVISCAGVGTDGFEEEHRTAQLSR